jgi:hypothetical protein
VAFGPTKSNASNYVVSGRHITGFATEYGYLHGSRLGEGDQAQYKVEVVATRIKYLERKK